MTSSTRRPFPFASFRRDSQGLRLQRRAGKARKAPGYQGLDQLEQRQLLGGDHPSFALPLSPTSGTQIVLDVNGQGTRNGVITPILDDDLFRFVAPADDFVTVWADTVNVGGGSALDSRVEVYDINGALVASGSSQGQLTAGVFNDGWAGFVATAGQSYFVRVRSDQTTGPGATGGYIVRVDAQTTPFTLDLNPNNPTYGLGGVAGNLTVAGWDIVYKVTADNVAAFDSLGTFNGTADAGDFDTRLDIYDATGTRITFDSEAGRLSNAFATARSTPGKVWYVRMRGDEWLPTRPTSQGEFVLYIDLAAQNIVMDPVVRRGQVNDGLNDGFDTRLYTFVSQGTGLTFVTVRGLPIPPLPDPAVHIYRDSDGAQIGFNKLGGAAELQIQLTGGERYYVVVEGFDRELGGLFGVWFESNHTFNQNLPVDDHVNTPNLGQQTPVFGTPEWDAIRRQFDLATPLVWGPDEMLLDGDGNPIPDREYPVNAQAWGRIHGTGDTDLFSFNAPWDMLGDYGGSNDNLGEALFVGGAGSFTIKGTSNWPNYDELTRDFLTMWDAQGYHPVRQGVNGIVRAAVNFDPDGSGSARPMAVVAGEFTMAGGITASRIAAYWYNPIQQVYQWIRLGTGVNGTVHAMTVYDPPGATPPQVIVGGEFTVAGGQAASRVAAVRIAPNGAVTWTPLGAGVTDTVYALTTWDQQDVGGAQVERSIIAGGAFAGGIREFDWQTNAWGAVGFQQVGIAPFSVTVNGTVRALTTWMGPDPLEEEDFVEHLIVGGQFTQVNEATLGNTAVSNIADIYFYEDVSPPPNSNPIAVFFIDNMGGGTNQPVYSLTSFDADGDIGTRPPLGSDPIVIAGGEFTSAGGAPMGFISGWDGAAWASIGAGMDGPVRVVFQFTDFECEERPGLPILYAGGDFLQADGQTVNRVAQFNPDAGEWAPMGGGSTDTVFALANLNDELPTTWDRKDRPASRLQIVLSPTTDSFANMFVRVYDSNFSLLYTNNTISPPFPDPAGMVDPSMTVANLGAIEGIEVWGGETYYIEVSSIGGNGRYTLAVRADGATPDLENDDVYTGLWSVTNDSPGEGNWSRASEIPITDLVTNADGRIYSNTAATYRGFYSRIYEPTPSCWQVYQFGDLGQIGHVQDSDLYYFRAPANGYTEVRISTTQIQDEYGEYWDDISTIPFPDVFVPGKTKVYNSALDAAIRIFDNDFELIAQNNDNPAVQGEYDTTHVGNQTRTFFARDPRIVFPVVAGEVYFIAVESGQRLAFETDPSTVEWRSATGSYELLVNSQPQLNFDDDHADVGDGLGIGPETMIPVDIGLGSGTVLGVIDNTLFNPFDVDGFGFFAPGTGIVTLRFARSTGSTLLGEVSVFEGTALQLVASGSANLQGSLTLQFPALRGERFYVLVNGGGGTEGGYGINISGIPYVDDFASHPNFAGAHELQILDFQGRATISGNIEAAGDTDVFKFLTPDFDVASVAVNAAPGSGLDAFVRIYEVSVDGYNPTGDPALPPAHPIHLQVAYNNDASPTTRDSFVRFPLTGRDRTYLPSDITYNYYYIVVSAANPNAAGGAYTLTLTVTPTDDHPDAGEFSFATNIVVDPQLGEGAGAGILEVSGDSDLLKFVAPAGGEVNVSLFSSGSTLRPRLRVFDSSFNPVTDLDSGLPVKTGGDVLLSATSFRFFGVRAVTYYVLVEGVAGGVNTTNTGAWALSLTTGTVDDHANQTEFTIATEIPLAIANGDGLALGTLGVARDSDLFFFTTLTGGTHRVSIDTVGSDFNPRLGFYTSPVEPAVQTIVDGGAGDEDGLRNGSIVFTINAGAKNLTYYLLVTSDPGGTVYTGDYAVVIDGQAPTEPPQPTNDDHPDAGEFNIATPILLATLTGDGSATGLIEFAADTDLFRFLSLRAGRVFVSVVTPPGSLLDAAVRIFGPDQTLIGTNAEGIPGSNAYIEFNTAGPGQFYYIEVDGLGAGTGAYTVKVDAEPEVHTYFFPEGFSSNRIREFVSVANPNTFAITYNIVLLYADTAIPPVDLTPGGRELAAGARGGLAISKAGQGTAPGVIKGKAYAIVITSSGTLGATLSHYDFGFSIGEAFTDRTSTSWVFARVEKSPGNVNDFLVLFNPNDNAVVVTLTAWTSQGPVVLSKEIGARRRGGWNINDTPEIASGIFGATIASRPVVQTDSHIGIIAALSHYDTGRGTGFAVLGDPDGGSTRGVITSLTSGTGIVPELTIFNPGVIATTVTITGSYIRTALPDVVRIYDLAPRQSLRLTASQLGFIAGQPIGLRWSSGSSVSMVGAEERSGDGTATQATTQVGLNYFFGDAFINTRKAGVLYFETLNFYNPDDLALNVAVTLFFADGDSSTFNVNVAGDGFATVDLHTRPEILNRGGNQFFSIGLTAPRPFAGTLTHYDLFLGGGWTATGAPLGLLTPVATIMS